jgi:hypothetical protein
MLKIRDISALQSIKITKGSQILHESKSCIILFEIRWPTKLTANTIGRTLFNTQKSIVFHSPLLITTKKKITNQRCYGKLKNKLSNIVKLVCQLCERLKPDRCLFWQVRRVVRSRSLRWNLRILKGIRKYNQNIYLKKKKRKTTPKHAISPTFKANINAIRFPLWIACKDQLQCKDTHGNFL